MTEFSKKTLENKDRFLKNGVTNIETVGHNGTHMNFPNYSTKFYTLEYISQQSIIKLNSQNNKFLKESYGAEGKYFCHYLGPGYIKKNYDCRSRSSKKKRVRTCLFHFYRKLFLLSEPKIVDNHKYSGIFLKIKIGSTSPMQANT